MNDVQRGDIKAKVIHRVYEKTATLSSWETSPEFCWFDQIELRVLVASENMRHRLLWLLITSYCVWGAFL